MTSKGGWEDLVDRAERSGYIGIEDTRDFFAEMEKGERTMKAKPVPFSLIEDAIQEDDNTGFCLYCHAQHFNIEPDARGYECEDCGRNGVFGAEEILMMGYVNMEEE